jgi:hypothetical protein
MSKAEALAQKYTKEQLWSKFDTLPEKVKGVILDPKTVVVLDGIVKENGVPIERGIKLARYVDFVLAGIVPITLLRETLEEELQIDEDRARIIATQIRDKIFMQVKDELRKIHKLE